MENAPREIDRNSTSDAAESRQRVVQATVRGAWLGVLAICGLMIVMACTLHFDSKVPVDEILRGFARTWPALLIFVGTGAFFGASILRNAAAARERDTAKAQGATQKERLDAPRAYQDRLAQFLGAESVPAPDARSMARSRMAFFLTILPGVRRGPTSADAIRSILWRIRRALRGERREDASQNGVNPGG